MSASYPNNIAKTMSSLVGSPAYYFEVADLLYEWNDLAGAERAIEQGFELVAGSLTVHVEVLLRGYLGLARLRQSQGHAAAALAALDHLDELAYRQGFAAMTAEHRAAARAHLALRRGDLAAAHSWAAKQPAIESAPLAYPHERLHLTRVRVWLAMAAMTAQPALVATANTLLERLLTAADAAGRGSTVIECSLLMAQLRQTQGLREEALAYLDRALHLAEPEGYVRTILDEGEALQKLLLDYHPVTTPAGQPPAQTYVDSLLAAAGLPIPHPQEPQLPPPSASQSKALDPNATAIRSADRAATAELAEPLSERETDVLRLIAAGLSNQEIAEQLYVEVSTVKWHINNIYSKLGVRRRTQAATWAQRLGLTHHNPPA